MKISHSWLQTYFEEKIPSVEELGELFTFHSFEVDDIEGEIMDLKILPDRAHFCLCHKGIAEEVSVLTGLKMKEETPQTPLLKRGEGAVTSLDVGGFVKVEDPFFCRRYVYQKIENIKVQESPAWLKERLESVGQRSINNIVDITNFVMFDIGQPSHAFDADKIVGNLRVRRANDGEKLVLLDGTEISLTTEDSVIADDLGALVLGGVTGGKRAGVDENTTSVIIEAGNWEPTLVRKSAARFGIRKESSKRFENEITPEWAIKGMENVTKLILELCPDSKVSTFSDFYPNPVKIKVIDVTCDFINKKLGIDVPKNDVLDILNRFNIDVEDTGDVLKLTIPHHRLDLVIKDDIVEEVGRVYGYDKVLSKLDDGRGQVQTKIDFKATELIKNILVDEGFSEVSLYALVAKGDLEILYPLASDKKFLRTNLSDGLQKVLESNTRNADFLFLEKVKVFEIGKVFTNEGEHTSLAVGISHAKKIKGQTINEDIRQLREKLFERLGIKINTVCTIDYTGGMLMLNNKTIGLINNIDGILELNLDAILPLIDSSLFSDLVFEAPRKIEYKPFSIYPFMVRDIAVFVPEDIKSEEVREIILNNASDLLIKDRLFDSFVKKNEDGSAKISYAFRLIFQAFDKTLTDDEINPLMNNIATKMAEKGWEVR